MFFSRNKTADITKGSAAEARAEAFLLQQGLVKRAQNYRCKLGEIDLIMLHGDTLVFIEVRLRSHREFANAAESVTISKQRKIIRTAQYYLQEHQLTDGINCRFDVVAFNGQANPDWIKDAFAAY